MYSCAASSALTAHHLYALCGLTSILLISNVSQAANYLLMEKLEKNLYKC